jgi:hypothetical protein
MKKLILFTLLFTFGCPQREVTLDEEILTDFLGKDVPRVVYIKKVDHSTGRMLLENPNSKHCVYYTHRDRRIRLNAGELWTVQKVNSAEGPQLAFHRCLQPKVVEEATDEKNLQDK